MIGAIFYSRLLEKLYFLKYLPAFYFIGSYNEMKFEAVYLDHSRFVVSKSENKKSTQKYRYFFLILHNNICCGCSLEAPRGGASNEYPQHMFSWRNIIWIFLLWKSIWTKANLRVNIFSTSRLLIDDVCSKRGCASLADSCPSPVSFSKYLGFSGTDEDNF